MMAMGMVMVTGVSESADDDLRGAGDDCDELEKVRAGVMVMILVMVRVMVVVMVMMWKGKGKGKGKDKGKGKNKGKGKGKGKGKEVRTRRERRILIPGGKIMPPRRSGAPGGRLRGEFWQNKCNY